MSNGDLLQIEPIVLQFPFEQYKIIPCSLQLINKSDNRVAFRVKTTNAKKYCVKPKTGVILPHSRCDVTVCMQALEAPPDLLCNDKFLIQSAVVSAGTSTKDITPEMFNKEPGKNVEECKLRVVYVPPPRPQDNSFVELLKSYDISPIMYLMIGAYIGHVLTRT